MSPGHKNHFTHKTNKDNCINLKTIELGGPGVSHTPPLPPHDFTQRKQSCPAEFWDSGRCWDFLSWIGGYRGSKKWMPVKRPWEITNFTFLLLSLALKVHQDAWTPQGSSVQFSSVAQSCPTLCYPINRSMSGLPVHHQLPEFTQTHVHWVGDAIQPSHPLSSPSPPAPNPSQHQGLFQWVNSSHEVAKVLEFQL